MKPIYLEFSGFKSFSQRASVDFGTLMKGGLFGIFGDTGAGKSTVLDAMGYALYGEINRIGKAGTAITDIINFGCQKAEVLFRFEAEKPGGERNTYEIRRSLTAKGVSKAELSILGGEGRAVLENQPNKVTKRVREEILGMDFGDYKKCVALPQGEFAQFLESDKKERLSLIVRLFSLERYGDALTDRVKARAEAQKAALSGKEGELKRYAGVSDEGLQSLKEEQAAVSEAYSAADKAWADLDAACRQGEGALKAQSELAQTREELSKLLPKEARMRELRGMHERLERAWKVSYAQDEADDAETYLKGAAEHAEMERYKLGRHNAHVERNGYREKLAKKEAEIALCRESVATVKGASVSISDLEAKRAKLKKDRAELERLKARHASAYAGFDPAAEEERLKATLSSLPQAENLTAYVSGSLKPLLLSEEYACFAGELEGLQGKYPEIEPDTAPLIERYRGAAGSAASPDIRAEVDRYERAQAQKRDAQDKLAALEAKKERLGGETQVILMKEEALKELEAECAEKEGALSGVLSLGSLSALESGLKELLKEKADLEKRIADETASGENHMRAISEAEKEEVRGKADLDRCKKVLEDALEGSGFENSAEAKALLSRYGDPRDVKEETDRFFRQFDGLREKEKWQQEALDAAGPVPSEEELRARGQARDEKKAARDEAGKRLGECGEKIRRAEADLKSRRALEAEYDAEKKRYEVCERLREALRGRAFLEYAAAGYLDLLAKNANNMLRKLSGGRYFLVYGDSFEVGDNYNAGETRGTHTLSGGEKFLVSLSLALSLSETIQQRALRRIEFFFLDEGFGTLDSDLLDTVMEALGHLRNEHFSVGVITHVERLRDCLPASITVQKASEQHGSSISEVRTA